MLESPAGAEAMKYDGVHPDTQTSTLVYPHRGSSSGVVLVVVAAPHCSTRKRPGRERIELGRVAWRVGRARHACGAPGVAGQCPGDPVDVRNAEACVARDR